MTTYLGKSCSFCLPRVPFVNCRQFMYLVIFLLVLRAGYGIWLYQFLIIAYLFTFHRRAQQKYPVKVKKTKKKNRKNNKNKKKQQTNKKKKNKKTKKTCAIVKEYNATIKVIDMSNLRQLCLFDVINFLYDTLIRKRWAYWVCCCSFFKIW